MGNFIVSTVANLFLGHIERNQPDRKISLPKVYLCYVDSIFCIYDSNEKINPFFNILNIQHHNLE